MANFNFAQEHKFILAEERTFLCTVVAYLLHRYLLPQTTSRERAMPLPTADKRANFRKLHEGGCFVIPNPFDIGTAKALQHLGFKAIASTSAGFAWTIGKADNRVTVDDVCDHLAAISSAVDIPVNADFEGGFAVEPEGVAKNVARAVKTGLAGLSIEDSTGDKAKPLFDRNLAIARIKAARQAIDADNSGVLLTGRCEALLWGQTDLNLVIDRLNAYSDAGADCLYAPGIKTKEEIAAVVKAVHPKPVNLLIGASGLSQKEAADLGVRRISVGGSLARSAWGSFMRAAKEMAEKGTFTELTSGYSGGELNKMFS
jgi:2-methylisocitrate lyase-like PEP mutase family enzyme